MKNLYTYYILIMFILTFGLSFSSPKWYIEVVDNKNNVGDCTSIKLDKYNYPHISYGDYGGYDNYLRYAYFNGQKWNIEIIDGPRVDEGYTSLSLDSNENPHISYCYDDCLKRAYYDGKNWIYEIIDNKYTGGYSSISIDSKNNIHIAYSNYINGELDLKYAYYGGSKWNLELVDSKGDVGWYPSLATDSNDHPHISYTDMTNNKPKYAYFDGTKWNIEVIDPNSDLGRCTSIDIDSHDNPHVAYLDVGILKYAYWNGRSWIIKVVDNDNVGGHISLSLDSNDLPYISYCYWNNYDVIKLMYIHFDGKEWHKEIVDNGERYAGFSTSIVMDGHNYPHISYMSDSYLKYARYGYGVGIDLTSFSATPDNNAITLNWSVSTDEDISGFNLYRRVVPPGVIHELPLQHSPVGEGSESPSNTEDEWQKVNTSLITGNNPYSYTDRDVVPETTYKYKLEAVVLDRQETLGTTECTSGNGTPASFNIKRVYPTPSDNQISIDVVIPEQSNIDIAIYDISGRKVSTVASGLYSPGEYTLTSDVTGLTNGVYIVKMTTDGFSASKNFVVAK